MTMTKTEAALVLSVVDGNWNDVARIRWRFTAKTGRIVDRVEFSRKLRTLERESVVESSKKREGETTEGVLWRRKERG